MALVMFVCFLWSRINVHCRLRQYGLWRAHDIPTRHNEILDACAENGTYSVRNLCFLKVDVQVTIGHSCDLIDFTKGLVITRGERG